jgi:XTP/dITP diphosphohydrolase
MAKRILKGTTTTDGRRRTDERRRRKDRRTGSRKGPEAREGAITMLAATTNAHKLKEILSLLNSLPIHVKTLKDFSDVKIPAEEGSTFAENARAKALYYAKATGLTTMAEDSGFEVEALDCQPGIYSARYLRPNATYPERFEAIYSELRKRRVKTSGARFVCALALASGGKITFETKGVVEGQLAAHPAGTGGFGYDPIFCYPPYDKTFAEITPEEKTAVSHRGEAIRALRAHLEQKLNTLAKTPTR